jgi:L-2,4-diaminobutyric acid acetyltransferase
MGRRTVEAGLKNPPGNERERSYALRAPIVRDGAAIWNLVRRSKPLDENSCYAYLLLCEHFADTCVVATREGDVIGFVSGYLPPKKDGVVFVWQVAVDEGARGMGLASAMLNDLLERPACAQVRYLETTISPGNTASETLFRSLAARMNTECSEQTLFSSDRFGDSDREAEVLFRIGPMKAKVTGDNKHQHELTGER